VKDPLVRQRIFEIKGKKLRLVEAVAADRKSMEILIDSDVPIMALEIAHILENMVNDICREVKPPLHPRSEEMF
jgi:hypothetical protein